MQCMSLLSRSIWHGVFAWILTALVIAPPAVAGPAVTPAAQLTIVFRCDDYSSTSDTAFELRLIDLFRKHHVPITLAVIPCVAPDYDSVAPTGEPGVPLNEMKARILRDAMDEGVVEVAQHGYNHRFNGPAWRGEFVGLSYEDQRQRIAAGRALLTKVLGRDVTLFVPPNEKYDANTVRVFQELQFTMLSADVYGGPAVPSTLKYMPKTSDLADFWDDMARIDRLADPSPAMVVLFHNFDFREDKQHGGGKLSLDDLNKILDWACGQPNVRVTTFEELSRQRAGFDHQHLQDMQDLMSFGEARLLPSRAAGVYSLPAFPAFPQDLSSMRGRRHIVFIVFWISSLLLIVAAAYAAARASRRLIRTRRFMAVRVWLLPCLLWLSTCLLCEFVIRSPRLFKITFCLAEGAIFALVACIMWYRQERGRMLRR
jgi:peptidoglycan/xylan/chitin deacetylase (PgdA/CDA1 family)